MADNLAYRSRGDDSDYARDGDDGDEDDDEIDETHYKTDKDAVLFAIDVSSSMLEIPQEVADSKNKSKSRDSATSAALKCAYQLMQQRIITNPRDMMGILLFGTEVSKFQEDDGTGAGFQYPHCYLLSDLDRPEASDVKRLRTLIENEDEARSLLVSSAEPVSMSNVLFCANQIFTTKAANFSSRRLFLVTDNDNPHPSSKELRQSSVVRAKDLYDLGVVIELFPISKADHDFDRSRFYDDIVYRGTSSDPDAPAPVVGPAKAANNAGGMSLLQTLISSVMSRNPARRAYFSNMPLEIGPDFRISVKGYIIFKKQTIARSCYVYTGGEKVQLVEGKSTVMQQDTARTVQKTELRKAYRFGGESVTFTPEELSAIKNFGDPIIRIVGFKPLAKLPVWANIKPATFIYPTEDGYVGSTRTFSALYQSLLKKNKFALCWHIARRNAAPTVCALIPGQEKIDADGEQRMPPGLWLIRLPFADDIRSPPEIYANKSDAPLRASDELTDKMREVVQQLQLPKAQFDPFRYPNPGLQWHYKVLQAMALEEDVPEKAEDSTLPKYKQIDKRAGPYVMEWGALLDDELAKWQLEQSGRNEAKRPASASGQSGAKRLKTLRGDDEDGITDESMKARFMNHTLMDLKAPDLKAWAKSKDLGLKSTAKKQELIEAVEAYFENKMHVD